MQDRQRLIFKLLATSATLLGAFFAARMVVGNLASTDHPMEFSAIPSVENLAARNAPERKRVDSRQRNGGLADTLLIDSILTIVQNYYVDESRVENKALIEATLKTLEEQDIIRLSFPSESNWTATHNKESISFSLNKRYSFDDLVRDSLRLARFLEKVDPSLFKTRGGTDRSGAQIMLSAMLASLDPHSNLLSSEEYKDLRQGTEGSFGGLGVVVGMQDDVLTVVKPLPKSPASRAGVSKFDRIMQIDNKSTFGTTLDDLIQYMRGEPGTKVRLSLLRDGDLAPRSIFLTREIIQVDSVEWKLIDAPKGKIFYAFIDSFSSRTASELREGLIKAQQKNVPIAGIVLDMRSNPGGLLDQAVKVADLFLDEGRILSTQGRTKEYDTAKRNLSRFDYPIVVLNNGDTASASEIVAGALRDQGRALIVGEPSFGKGSVQTVFELPGEQALKLTIARYYTPSGVSIQNIGIMPDIWLQPIMRTKENLNLMGEYRYKSERFLDHSLDQNKLKDAGKEDLKAFYTLLPEKSPRDKPQDVPLDFSIQLLSELAKKDGIPYPVERLRASYWKASASGMIKKFLVDLDKKSQEWLKKDFKVDWANGGKANLAENDMQFAVQVARRTQLKEGELLEVPWQIKNNGKQALHRMSVYLSGVQSILGTAEVLVGKVAPGQSVKGILKFPMSIDAKEGSVRLRAGVAKSGWPLAGKEHNFTVELLETQEPDLSLDTYLSDDSGGSQAGVLEPGEKARIKLIVKNTSPVTASKIEVKLVNLAGTQVKLDESSQTIPSLRPNESRTMYVPILASANLMSEEFQFGVMLKSAEHVLPNKNHFSLPSLPNARVSKSNVMMGVGPWKEN